MKFFGLANSRSFYLLRFEQEQPVWELISEAGSSRVDPPAAKNRLPILAVVPDRYFFYYLPENQQSLKRKELHQAVQLQLKHLFPAPGPGEERRVLDTGTEVLGLCTRSDLQSFLDQHQDLLAKANAFTTPFLLTRALMSSSSSSAWFMHNPGDPLLLLLDNCLHYIFADAREMQHRLRTLGCSCEPVQLDLQDIILQLSGSSLPWSKLRIPLPELRSSPAHSRPLFKAAAALLVIGLLFCGGELLKLRSTQAQKEQWSQALDSLYTKALGPDYGQDPYGLLLYQARNSQGQDRQGLDFLELLGTLSQAAPQGLRIQDISLGLDSGTVQAALGSYEQMDSFMQNLKEASKYDFTLEQADTQEDKVQISLKIHY
ncbi:MAG: hypothetical protein ACOCY9_00130 [Desulfohalobiaceae bacterium]